MVKILKGLLGKVPYANALWSLLDHLGLSKILFAVAGVLIAGTLALWSWLESHLPLWAIGLVFLCALAVAEGVLVLTIDLVRKAKGDNLEPEKIADTLIKLSEEMGRWISDYRHSHSPRLYPTDDPNVMETSWEEQRRDSMLLTQRLNEQFGSRAMVATILMRKLEIVLPFFASHLDEHGAGTFAAYIGAIGRLLKEGNLETARTMSEDDAHALTRLVR